MTNDDRKSFLEIVVGFAELKGKQLSAPALELYWRSLRHWPLDDFRCASEQLLRTCEFMPMPKDFEDLRKLGRETSGEAWAAVLQRARGKGGKLSEMAQVALRAIGGLNTVMMSDVDKTPFLERRFCDHFDSIQDAEDIREAVPELVVSSHRLNGPTRAGDILGRLSGPEKPEF